MKGQHKSDSVLEKGGVGGVGREKRVENTVWQSRLPLAFESMLVVVVGFVFFCYCCNLYFILFAAVFSVALVVVVAGFICPFCCCSVFLLLLFSSCNALRFCLLANVCF